MKPPYYAACFLYCALIFWMSNQPDPPKPEIGLPHLDKVAHALVFGGLAALVSLGLHRSGRPHRTIVFHVVPVLAVLAYGAFDEIHQYFVPPRTPDILDLVADVTGGLLAQEICRAWFPRWPLAPDLQPEET